MASHDFHNGDSTCHSDDSSTCGQHYTCGHRHGMWWRLRFCQRRGAALCTAQPAHTICRPHGRLACTRIHPLRRWPSLHHTAPCSPLGPLRPRCGCHGRQVSCWPRHGSSFKAAVEGDCVERSWVECACDSPTGYATDVRPTLWRRWRPASLQRWPAGPGQQRWQHGAKPWRPSHRRVGGCGVAL